MAETSLVNHPLQQLFCCSGTSSITARFFGRANPIGRIKTLAPKGVFGVKLLSRKGIGPLTK
jgi:hypothetical protein